MFLNVNLASNGSANGVEGSCSTPRTPEILNLLSGAAYDNDFSKTFHNSTSQNLSGDNYLSENVRFGFGGGATGASASTPGDGPSSPGEPASSFSSSFSSMSSPATPSTPTCSRNTTPSIQNTRTYLIKEGLKLTIQSKRLASGRAAFQPHHVQHLRAPFKDEMGQLTTEDEDRRRRRRERNKVAATKCRNRKKERTGILMQESDVLEDQNVSFRTEIQRLETEKRRLMDVLAMHSPNCLKTGGQTALGSTDYMNDSIDPNGQDGQYPTMPRSSYDALYDCRGASSSAGAVSQDNSYDLSPCNSFSNIINNSHNHNSMTVDNSCSSSSSYQVNMNHQPSYR